jgi:hypothetical protein
MDRCSVPGYYYDQEKKKYFRVQPDHVAPPNAKYSASKVKREESRDRDAKRQKLDEELRRVETVTPSRALRTLSGFGLKREIGGRSQASHAAQLDQNLANGLTHVDLSMGRLEIHDVIHVHQTGTYLFAGRLGNDFIEGKHHDTQNAKRDVPKPTTGWNVMGVKVISDGRYCSTTSPLPTSLRRRRLTKGQTTIDTIRRGSDHYVLSYSNERQALQAVIYPVVTPQDMCKYSRFDIVPDGFYHYLKQVWGFADCPVAEATAFFGTGILNIDTQTAQARELYEPSPTEEIFAACFTQPHILAFGMRKQLGIFEPADHAVFLWDIRQPTHHSSCALRIHRPDKITGLEKLDDSGKSPCIPHSHPHPTNHLPLPQEPPS